VYTGAVREAVHAFKYQGHRRLGTWLADAAAALTRPHAWLTQCELLVPVPMFWIKARLKGWQPASWLAQRLAQRLQRPCTARALLRTRWTATQTRLTRTQRARNVAEAFRARPDLVAGRRLLLIDDVLTTGATAHACALALRDAGATAVSVLTLAMAP
jgi:ComF family protein